MTRRDYILISRALHEARPNIAEAPEDVAAVADALWDHICDEVADALAGDNARFDKARFIRNCQEGTA